MKYLNKLEEKELFEILNKLGLNYNPSSTYIDKGPFAVSIWYKGKQTVIIDDYKVFCFECEPLALNSVSEKYFNLMAEKFGDEYLADYEKYITAIKLLKIQEKVQEKNELEKRIAVLEKEIDELER